jgi:hypothetical protein
MSEFFLGFYLCGLIQTGALVYVALEQQKPSWGPAKRLAVSIGLGLFWFVLAPWLLHQAAGGARKRQDS